MTARKWLFYLLCAAGAIVALFIVVAAGGFLLGLTAPDRVSFAWVARFEESPDQVWSVLKFPTRRTEVRERADGVRYEAAAGDTGGSLVLLYEPTSRVVEQYAFTNAEILSVVTFTPDRGGTVVRAEDSAYLWGPWHRLLFPSQLREHGKTRLRSYGDALGRPKLEVSPSAPGQSPIVAP